MGSDSLPYRVADDGVLLAVRLTPRANRSEVTGIVDGGDGRPALAVRVAAPPVDGAANKALVLFLAKELGLPKSAVAIRSGETARLKIVFLATHDADVLERLSRLARPGTR